MQNWIKELQRRLEDKSITIEIKTLGFPIFKQSSIDNRYFDADELYKEYWCKEFQSYLDEAEKEFGVSIPRGFAAAYIHDEADWEGNEPSTYYIYGVSELYKNIELSDAVKKDGLRFAENNYLMRIVSKYIESCAFQRDFYRSIICIPCLVISVYDFVSSELMNALRKTRDRIPIKAIPVFLIQKPRVNMFDISTNKPRKKFRLGHLDIMKPLYMDKLVESLTGGMTMRAVGITYDSLQYRLVNAYSKDAKVKLLISAYTNPFDISYNDIYNIVLKEVIKGKFVIIWDQILFGISNYHIIVYGKITELSDERAIDVLFNCLSQ